MSAKSGKNAKATTVEDAAIRKAALTEEARTGKRAARAEAQSTQRRRVAAEAPNPAWLAPTAVTLLILALLYLVVYYITSAQLPLPIGDWNLAVGVGLLMVGGGMLMFWK